MRRILRHPYQSVFRKSFSDKHLRQMVRVPPHPFSLCSLKKQEKAKVCITSLLSRGCVENFPSFLTVAGTCCAAFCAFSAPLFAPLFAPSQRGPLEPLAGRFDPLRKRSGDKQSCWNCQAILQPSGEGTDSPSRFRKRPVGCAIVEAKEFRLHAG